MTREKKRKLTSKQEKFIREYLKGKSATESYKAAGYSTKNMKPATVHNNAYMLLNKSEISARIEESKTKSLEKAEISREWIIEKLRENAEQCMTSGSDEDNPSTFNPNAANKALELLGKELGMFVERSENVNTNFVIGATSEKTEEKQDPIIPADDPEEWVQHNRLN